MRRLLYVKCTLPMTRQTDNFVVIMGSNHSSFAMLSTHPFMLWESHMECTWIGSCVVVFTVLHLLRSFYVTLRRRDIFGLTCRRSCLEHVTHFFRKAAYYQFALWRYGKLGRGNRRVIPSYAVLQIRHTYDLRFQAASYFFEYLITLASTPRLCRTGGKIGHVTGYLIGRYSLCNLHVQVSPITNPSYEAFYN